MNECSICLEEIHKDTVKPYECIHVFHIECAKQWKGTCPFCRAKRRVVDITSVMLKDSLRTTYNIQIQFGQTIEIIFYETHNVVIKGVFVSYLNVNKKNFLHLENVSYNLNDISVNLEYSNILFNHSASSIKSIKVI